MSPTAPLSGRHTVPLNHQGRERPYLLHDSTNGRQELVPLVLELHGRGVNPSMFDRWTGFASLADEVGFVLALPSALGDIWNDGRYRGPDWAWIEGVDDVGYLRAVEVAAGCHPIVPVPILQIHGTGDWAAPYAGGRASGLRARLFLRHRADPCVGVDEWVSFWVDANGADRGPDVTTIPPDTTVRRWFGTSPASDTVFYRVAAGGHTWPGNRLWVPPLFGRTSRAFDATAVTWDFFAAHAREA